MYRQIGLLFILIAALLAISCKDEGKSAPVENKSLEVVAEKPVTEKIERRELTPAEKEKANSVMSRLIVIPESKKFARYLVTANLTDILTDDKGPLWVFAPSNASIEALSIERRKFYSNKGNLSKLQDILKSHIVKRGLNDEDFLQALKKDGKLKLKTLDGITLTATESDDKIVISDEKGGKATIQKTDVKASNGQVFIIDGVLNLL